MVMMRMKMKMVIYDGASIFSLLFCLVSEVKASRDVLVASFAIHHRIVLESSTLTPHEVGVARAMAHVA